MRDVMYAIMIAGTVVLVLGLIVFSRFYVRERMRVLENQRIQRRARTMRARGSSE